MSPPRRPGPAAFLTAALLASLALCGGACGYALITRGSALPAHVKSIGVADFRNETNRPELGHRITENVIEAVVGRGRYRVSTETSGVDAVISGAVMSWTTRTVRTGEDDSSTQRVAVTLRARVAFEDLVLKRVTWRQDSFTFTAEYDVIGDPDQYFDTELGAVEEVASDFARAVVSSIMTGF